MLITSIINSFKFPYIKINVSSLLQEIDHTLGLNFPSNLATKSIYYTYLVAFRYLFTLYHLFITGNCSTFILQFLNATLEAFGSFPQVPLSFSITNSSLPVLALFSCILDDAQEGFACHISSRG